MGGRGSRRTSCTLPFDHGELSILITPVSAGFCQETDPPDVARKVMRPFWSMVCSPPHWKKVPGLGRTIGRAAACFFDSSARESFVCTCSPPLYLATTPPAPALADMAVDKVFDDDIFLSPMESDEEATGDEGGIWLPSGSASRPEPVQPMVMFLKNWGMLFELVLLL